MKHANINYVLKGVVAEGALSLPVVCFPAESCCLPAYTEQIFVRFLLAFSYSKTFFYLMEIQIKWIGTTTL
jgi:hypothetical protein